MTDDMKSNTLDFVNVILPFRACTAGPLYSNTNLSVFVNSC